MPNTAQASQVREVLSVQSPTAGSRSMATALPPVLLLVRGDQAKLEPWWNRLSQERRVRPLQTAGDHVREDIELALFHDFATSVRLRCSSGAANKRMSRVAITAKPLPYRLHGRHHQARDE